MQFFPGHTCLGYIAYNIYCLLLQTTPSILGIVIGIVFSLLPDIDVIIFIIARIKYGKSKEGGLDFKHHEYPTHFPLLYSPLIVITIIFPNIYTFTMVTALYLHLFVDSFYTSDGIKWLYPFQNKYFCFLSEKTKGKEGILWVNEYKGTAIYKLEFILLIIVGLIILLSQIYYYSTPVEYIWLYGVLIIGFIIGFFFIDRASIVRIKKKVAELTDKGKIQSF